MPVPAISGVLPHKRIEARQDSLIVVVKETDHGQEQVRVPANRPEAGRQPPQEFAGENNPEQTEMKYDSSN